MPTREARIWNSTTQQWDLVGTAPGPKGDIGPKGDAATIKVGTVTTLPAGANATVTNSGSASDATFDFGIPKGQDGDGDIIPIGSIFPFAGSTIPAGWLLCDGSPYDPGTYPKLAEVIGSTFGSNKVPDLRAKFPLGAVAGDASKDLGSVGGSNTIDQVVAHTHTVTGSVSVTVSQDNGLAVSGSAGTGGDHNHPVQGTGSTTTDGGAHAHGYTDSQASGNREGRQTIASPTNTVASLSNTGVSSTTTTAGTTHTHTVILSLSSQNAGGHSHSFSGSTGAHSHTASGSLSGASAASTGQATVSVLNPFLAINYIIKAA